MIKLQYNYGNLGGINFEKDLTAKKIHLICTARNGGLSIFQEEVLIFRHKEITREKALNCLEMVNVKNETGTMFPQFSITLLPLTKYGDRDSFGDESKMKANIIDCLNANELYVKSEKIIFAFDKQHDFDGELALEVLEEVLKTKNDFNFTKEIFCTPFIQI